MSKEAVVKNVERFLQLFWHQHIHNINIKHPTHCPMMQ